ncbi:MAG: nucleoside kinase [Saccharofermentanales bacterium]
MAKLEHHVQVTLEELEQNFSLFKLEDYIRDCEKDFDDKVSRIAERISANPQIRSVFISGPTASGKTTFTYKLCEALGGKGVVCHSISLDDYYFPNEFKTDEYGRPDYESLEILDTKLMLKQIKEIFEGKEVIIPSFDFRTKKRMHAKAKSIKLPQNGVLMLEGLHGLSKSISGLIPKEKWLGIFIMPYATLTEDVRLLDKRDIRILRRIARDVICRGATALATIDYWPMLDKAEEIYFPEYLANADEYINSILPYEFYCVAPMAHDMIGKSLLDFHNGILTDSNFTRYVGFAQIDIALKEAERLYYATDKIPKIDIRLVPESSLLNEFICDKSPA